MPGQEKAVSLALAGREGIQQAERACIRLAQLGGRPIAQIVQTAIGRKVVPEVLQEVVPTGPDPGALDRHVGMSGGESQAAVVEVVVRKLLRVEVQAAQAGLVAKFVDVQAYAPAVQAP